MKKTILLVDDEKSIRETVSQTLLNEGYNVFAAEDGEKALDILIKNKVNLIITDIRMENMDGMKLLKASRAIAPEVEVILLTAYGTIELAVEAMKIGAYDFLVKPFKKMTLLKSVEKALEKQALTSENIRLREMLESKKEFENIIGQSDAIRKVLNLVKQVASTSATVLIEGESGSGKELIANAIHFLSERIDKPFIKVSCAALPETLLESELFGYEKGAFTGAITRKEGRFERAHGGTLLLDEVGEMSSSTQIKLLRVLQNWEFERLGGTSTIKVDVRIIAATNTNLTELINQKKFREDLYYRLNVISIPIPSLRERKEDIPFLAYHFLKVYSEKNKKKINSLSKETLDIFSNYNWPGNVRELENTIERVVVLCNRDTILPEDLPSVITKNKYEHDALPVGMSLDELEKEIIKKTLEKTKGDKEIAAKLLGISLRTLYRKLEIFK